jgi:hypothetical protein
VIHADDINPATGNKWYEDCEDCNYANHRCYFCGEYLSHDGYDPQGNLHDVAFCRPDLVEHEPGPLCTWPDDPELNEYREPWCYWDHENNRLKEKA